MPTDPHPWRSTPWRSRQRHKSAGCACTNKSRWDVQSPPITGNHSASHARLSFLPNCHAGGLQTRAASRRPQPHPPPRPAPHRLRPTRSKSQAARNWPSSDVARLQRSHRSTSATGRVSAISLAGHRVRGSTCPIPPMALSPQNLRQAAAATWKP